MLAPVFVYKEVTGQESLSLIVCLKNMTYLDLKVFSQDRSDLKFNWSVDHCGAFMQQTRKFFPQNVFVFRTSVQNSANAIY